MASHYEWMMKDPDIKHNIELLNTINFKEFFYNGLSLQTIKDRVEEKYDKIFFEKYGMYVFDYLDSYDIMAYFEKRYNVAFQEYTDWVLRCSPVYLTEEVNNNDSN